jgi:hypothetical protein
MAERLANLAPPLSEEAAAALRAVLAAEVPTPPSRFGATNSPSWVLNLGTHYTAKE